MKYFSYKKFKIANNRSLQGLWNVFPVALGILLLISIVMVIIPKSIYGHLFSGNLFFDSIIGASLGSILAGNPVTGYILGNGFLKSGISLIAVTAFIVAWATVGIIQFPAESLILGKRFAISRNMSSFTISIITAIITVTIINIF